MSLYLTITIVLEGNPLNTISYLLRGDEVSKDLEGWPFELLGKVNPNGEGGGGGHGYPG